MKSSKFGLQISWKETTWKNKILVILELHLGGICSDTDGDKLTHEILF